MDRQALGGHVYKACGFAEADDALIRQIRDVALSEEREQMVFAEAEELDVLHHLHLVIADAEGGAVQDALGVLMVAAGEKLERVLETLRGLAQALALGVFAH